MTNRFEFPIGYRHLHDDANYNFQLNRWLTYWDEEEVRYIAANISDLATWKSELLKAARTCEAENRALNAAFFYRAAEFFIAPDDPDKLIAYNRFRELFYAEVTNPLMTRVNVPYEGSTLPALIFPADGPKRDTVLVHGGFDSFKEEFIEMAATFTSQGIEFILFEGPGQGEPLMLNHLAMPTDWERPVGAILDHLQISSCSLIGISLGGYLAPRAAAFDKRIRRVVAYDVLEDFLGCLSAKLDPGAQKLLALLMRMRARHTINTLMSGVIKKDEFARWAFGHGMHVSGTTMPYDYLKWVESFTTAPFAPLIDQDFLLLGGAEDHLVPLPQFFSQANNLPNVRSLTTRLFTDKEHASSHCQVGNLQLAADWIANWLVFQLEHPEIGT
ncbi:MAG: alpha/beta fold hydrolase [Parvibaculaceae bacterium]|nr:alpha/beta fold hydrolase [Parvibaculaceae bacterium]